MSSAASSASRHIFRRSANARLAAPRGIRGTRFESSTPGPKPSEASKTAQDTARAASETAAIKAAELQKQAAAGLAKAQEYSKNAAAGLSKAGESAQAITKQLSQSGGTVGRLAGIIDKQIPTFIYYSRVAIETFKLVAKAQKMAPPPISAFQTYYEAVLSKLKNPARLIESAQEAAQNMKSISTAQMVAGGVVFAECVGFFTVGEMVGRLKIVGYSGKKESHGH